MRFTVIGRSMQKLTQQFDPFASQQHIPLSEVKRHIDQYHFDQHEYLSSIA